MISKNELDGSIYERVSNASAPPELRAVVDASLDVVAELAPLCELTHLGALAALHKADQRLHSLMDCLRAVTIEWQAVEKNKVMLEKECARLEQELTWQEARRTHIGTHGPDCFLWGHRHYNCALIQIDLLNKTLANLSKHSLNINHDKN